MRQKPAPGKATPNGERRLDRPAPPPTIYGHDREVVLGVFGSYITESQGRGSCGIRIRMTEVQFKKMDDPKSRMKRLLRATGTKARTSAEYDERGFGEFSYLRYAVSEAKPAVVEALADFAGGVQEWLALQNQ